MFYFLPTFHEWIWQVLQLRLSGGIRHKQRRELVKSQRGRQGVSLVGSMGECVWLEHRWVFMEER